MFNCRGIGFHSTENSTVLCASVYTLQCSFSTIIMCCVACTLQLSNYLVLFCVYSTIITCCVVFTLQLACVCVVCTYSTTTISTCCVYSSIDTHFLCASLQYSFVFCYRIPFVITSLSTSTSQRHLDSPCLGREVTGVCIQTLRTSWWPRPTPNVERKVFLSFLPVG